MGVLFAGCTQQPPAASPAPATSEPPAGNATPISPSPSAASPSQRPLIDVPELSPSPVISSTPTPFPITFISRPNVTLDNLTAIVTWKTAQLSSTTVEWGTNEKYDRVDANTQNSTLHSINLSGLKFLTTYHFRAISCIADSCNKSTGLNFTSGHKQCPSGTVYVAEGDFCIDRFEATVRDGRAISQGGSVPANLISREDSQKACAAAGKRLCTSEEFTAACNIKGEKYGPIGQYECALINSSYIPAGHASNCTTDGGAKDLIGNFWEWVSDDVNDDTPFTEGLVDLEDVLYAGRNYQFSRQASPVTEKFGNDYYYNWEPNAAIFSGTGIIRGGYYKSQQAGGCFTYAVGVPLIGSDKISFRCCS